MAVVLAAGRTMMMADSLSLGGLAARPDLRLLAVLPIIVSCERVSLRIAHIQHRIGQHIEHPKA